MGTAFEVIPAIDLREGGVVRLRQGDYARQTDYAHDPRSLAREYAQAGARWLHVVDLDGARGGTLENLRVIAAIAADGGSVQAGGGVRSEEDLRRLFDAGVRRGGVGSTAIREPARVAGWIGTYGPERIVLALDTRQIAGRWTLPSAGWTEAESRSLDELAPWYAAHGARHLLCTDISRDGMLTGFNLDLYRDLSTCLPGVAVQASGGARVLEDIRAARRAGAGAVILGRALLEGRFTLAEALAC